MINFLDQKFSQGLKYYLDIIKNTQDYDFTISDLNDRAILHFNTQGLHFLRLPEGTYYIKVSAKDFKYDPNEMYTFTIKDSKKRIIKKQPAKKSARNIKKPMKKP